MAGDFEQRLYRVSRSEGTSWGSLVDSYLGKVERKRAEAGSS